MSDGDDLLHGPELQPLAGSEIEAVIDLSAVGTDGMLRPVMINQDGTDFIQITMEDAERLHKFLGAAIVYLKKEKAKILQ